MRSSLTYDRSFLTHDETLRTAGVVIRFYHRVGGRSMPLGCPIRLGARIQTED
jgi:hypothetical protein